MKNLINIQSPSRPSNYNGNGLYVQNLGCLLSSEFHTI